MRLITAALLFGLGSSVSAQLTVPVGLTLTGSDPGSRQVRGLADPIAPDAAVSVDAARAGAVSTVAASGTDQLVASLFPEPGALVVGMLVTIMPANANDLAPTLDLNGLGAYPIVKWGQVPLDSADLAANVPARLVFDGSRFLLLNDLSRPCPAGTKAMSSTYCISDSTLGEGTFYEAVNACAVRGARLCSFGEWAHSCRNKPGFLGTVNAYEWVDDAANNPNDAKTVGGGYAGPLLMEGYACEYGLSRAPLSISRYRCCLTR